MSRKVLFIGLDGSTFDVLDPLMDAGLMPRLKGFIDEGVRGLLETTIPPITPTAWVSWMTGKNPGKHGVFEFLLRRKGSGSLPDMPVSARARDGLPFWDVLGQMGKQAIVTNVPCTYPPTMVNGVMISDFLTPKGRRDFAFPEKLLEEVEAKFGPYQLYITEVYTKGKVDNILNQLFEELEYKTKVNRYLMNEYGWDVFATHYWGTDRFQHELWHLLDQAHPFFDRKEHDAHIGRIEEYWHAVDSTLGELFDEAGKETTVYLGSDHGFGPIKKFLCFNVWLINEGLLVLKGDAMTRVKRAIFRLGLTPDLAYRSAMKLGLAHLRLSVGVSNRSSLMKFANMLMLSLEDVDWTRTVAFSKGNYGQIFINLKGRETHGIVEPGAEYDRVLGEVIHKLRGLKDPDSGESLIGPIWRREDLYTGPHKDESPDIQFLPTDMANKPLGTLDLTSNKFITPVYGNSGDHRMHGIMLGRGPDLKRNATVEGARIIDYAPTILHTFGTEIPSDMDGRVLSEIFTEEYMGRNPVRISDAAAYAEAEKVGSMTDEESDEIRERLRGWGYLG
ncbi:MAG TPA: alkaline phosphatase family protein [Blastocatellia bacterium]|jgi:predicted AlkP superfamily phosphohydrolase/phosphomutase|nr:alkaline phosphatase family protein [Blastocatellia bacterium]